MRRQDFHTVARSIESNYDLKRALSVIIPIGAIWGAALLVLIAFLKIAGIS